MLAKKVDLTDSTIVRAILWILLFAGIFYFKSIVFVLFLSVILASVSNRFSSYLRRIKIPRTASIILFYIVFIALIFLTVYIFVPTIVRYIGSMINNLPELLNSFKTYNPENSAWYSNFLSYIIEYLKSIDVNLLSSKIRSWLLNTSVENSSSIIKVVTYFFVTVITAFYISLSEKGVQNFIKLLTPKRYENYMIHLFDRVERKISSWFLGQVLVAFIVGLAIYLILLICKIPFALPIAFLAFLLELIPMLGTTLSAIPAVFFAWNIGGISLSILIIVLFFIVSQLSSYLLYPRIVGKFVDIPTVVVIIAIFAGAEIGGLWGALIAIPLSTILMEILSDFGKSKEKENILPELEH